VQVLLYLGVPILAALQGGEDDRGFGCLFSASDGVALLYLGVTVLADLKGRG